ncbi:MAG: winged helix-turn-helix domain-containing protein [Butyribacter sp.]|jgi:DNA-binding response OmpR family regulator|uniref:winged helix-turn-helix domain-containing protein n=1 Tax=Butyribacter TaxID=2822463 RepID=UPI000338E9C7|nr:winged-helix domain-containing protein [Clostridium sp.]MCQ5164408.1 winged helix-turn-helix domain-containing protein [Roseburia hominis]OKZ80029.1 MAG: hypothetical protein BHW08_08090 [Clostridium sp. CAG:12237_41]UYJ41823.1 MAG: winged helix-turn-helix domain-containing protein [Lachnospiraceae bacterium]CCZ42622.1 two-component response regulator [Clostridium sp. CAG:122]
MGGYIVLCDHNSKWAEKFTDEAIKRNIQTVVVESIAEIEDKLTADGSSIMLVCSLIELREYLKNNTVDEKIFFEKVSVFVISDSNDDNEEIYYIRQGCVDFQWRKRNIFIIVERIRALLNKIEKAGEMIIDTKELMIIYDKEKINLKKREADIISILYNRDEIVSTEEICLEMWGVYDEKTKSNLYNAIYELRRKLAGKGGCIQNIYGKGFILSKDGIRIII